MDIQNIIMGEEDLSFLWEIAFRTFLMFFLLFVGLRIMGKRGVKQISVFELLCVIALGSAAGDPMIYKEVGIVYAAIVFFVVFLIYWLITVIMTHSEKFEALFEGKAVCLIRDGKASEESLSKKKLAPDEFFMSIRNHHILHLGQIENAVLEPNGEVSLLLYNEEDIKPGLPIWPEHLKNKTFTPDSESLYSCIRCGHTQIHHSIPTECSYCHKKAGWIKSVDGRRDM